MPLVVGLEQTIVENAERTDRPFALADELRDRQSVRPWSETWNACRMSADRYSVRKAERDDLLSAVRLIDLSPHLVEDQITALQRATWDRMVANQDLTVYLAESGPEPVGYTASLQMPHLTYSCRPTVFIESMHVFEGHRRRGVARRMVERLLADARADGCHKVQLLTHKRHAVDGAHDFYRSLGFKAEAEGFRLYLN